MTETTPKVYTVSSLTLAVKALIESSPIHAVFVEGEISGWRIYGSGHAYFKLKDAGAVLSAVMFSGSLARCDAAFRAQLKDGAKIRAWGQLEVYAPYGSYQLVVRQVWPAGAGDLMAKFNELKKKLEGEGLFDPAKKRKLPFLPHRVAIVTSPSGAVIHDMVTVLTRRFPNLEIRLYPVRVQGEGAAAEIVAGVEFFNAAADGWVPDVLIVGRGGGSIEDLWAFNEEPVVRAVAASRVPTVSAVGHETDFTLCDFAADVRAGTPSIAAELVAPVKAELAATLADLAARLARAPGRAAETHVQTLDHLSLRLAAALKAAAADRAARLAAASGRLAPALRAAAQDRAATLQTTAARLRPALDARLAAADSALRDAATRLRLLNPYDVLKRGYSITTGPDGRVVKSAAAVKAGDRLSTRLADGAIASVVE